MDDEGVLLSVRGEATQTVTPDAGVLVGSLTARRDSKQEALATVAAALNRLTEDVARIGGVPLSVGTERSPLTWSAFSTSTEAEWHNDVRTGHREPTERVVATVRVRLTVRDLDLLDELGAALADHEDFDVHQVAWQADPDNPVWAAVRSAAVQSALRKGQDYAKSLGVSLVRVEQVADAGLLSGAGEVGHAVQAAARLSALSHAAGDTPSLDPVPQELSAIVEARLRGSPAPLPT